MYFGTNTHTTQEESADSSRGNDAGAILYCHRYKRSYDFSPLFLLFHENPQYDLSPRHCRAAGLFSGQDNLKAFQKAFQVSIELYASKCQKNQQTVLDVYRLFCFTTTGNFKRNFGIAWSIQIAMPLSCSLLLVVMFGIRRRFSLLLIFQRCYLRRSLLVFDRVVCTYTRSDSDEQRNQ